MGLVRQVAALLFIIAIPIALVTTNVRIVVNEPRLYEYAADEFNTPERTGIARAELLRASGELRDYFNNDDEEIFVQVPKNGELVPLFSPRETAHLRDVKNLFQGSFLVQEISVLFVLGYVVAVFIWAREGSLRTLATQILLAGGLSLAVIAGLGAFAVTGFDQVFERFHFIAFDNDLWRLNPSRDHLIQMFPQDFWRNVSLGVGLVTMAELALLSLVSAVYLGLTRRGSVSYSVPSGAQPQASP